MNLDFQSVCVGGKRKRGSDPKKLHIFTFCIFSDPAASVHHSLIRNYGHRIRFRSVRPSRASSHRPVFFFFSGAAEIQEQD